MALIADPPVSDLVKPVHTRFLPARGISTVYVPAADDDVRYTSSCGNGTDAPPLPPFDVDHVAVEDQLPATTPYRVVAVVNVKPVFPWQSPSDVPVPAVPDILMSWKSAFVIETAVALIVAAVPAVPDCTSGRFVTELPVIVSVPVTVSVVDAAMVSVAVFTAPGV
jgi:hypothetical protein